MSRYLKKYYPRFGNGTIAIIFFLLISQQAIAQTHHIPDSAKEMLSWAIDSATSSDTIPAIPLEENSVTTGDTQTKSEYFSDKNLFSHESIHVRHLPDSVINKMKQDGDFWYASAVFSKNKEKKDNQKSSEHVPLGERTWFQTLIWLIIIGCFAAFIMIYLKNSNVLLFRKKPKNITSTAEEEMETDDIFGINYSKEIEKAVNRSNYRFAVRLMFLRLLKQLAEKNIIQYKQDKTNLDYLLQLNRTNYYQDFFRITRNYEYSWYGQFEISPENFSLIKNDFEKFEQRLG